MARDDDQFRLRIPEELKAQIRKSGLENGRTMTAEIIVRLRKSFEYDASLEDLANRIKKLEIMVNAHDELLRRSERNKN